MWGFFCLLEQSIPSGWELLRLVDHHLKDLEKREQ